MAAATGTPFAPLTQGPGDLVVQAPDGAADGLLLLFHGVGSSAEDLAPLGQVLARHLPRHWIVSVRSPEPCDLGSGWQWFSVRGVDEANRPARVDAAMPGFVATVQRWQAKAGMEAARTALLGFSQGAIMALESTQSAPGLAGRVVAIAGRFAQAPQRANPGTALHLVHGESDGVMPVALSESALQQWQALGGQATLDRLPGLGHGIDARAVDAVRRHLTGAT
jgi:phospholipase/carboxylesterase